MSLFDDATRAQIEAAEPTASTWLTANAGSGKTKVLTDRVTRLLLEGTDPEGVLCLTYTKAAAAEMQNRLFKRLGDWAMLDDDDLKAALGQTGLENPPDLGLARTLFARAIETPGGIKIQTIHAFCAMLLRRFPLEAGVSPGFRELDDAAAAALREDVADRLASEAPETVAAVATYLSTDDLAELTKAIADAPTAFPPSLDRQALADVLGVPPGTTASGLLSDLMGNSGANTLEALATALANGSKRDVEAGAKLAKVDPDNPALTDHAVLEELFLTQSGKAPFTAKVGHFPTKDTRAALGPHLDALEAMMVRAESLRQPRLALAALEKSDALRRFAQAFLPAYEAAKAARGVLDFSDLILRTQKLLSNPSVAQWILYRIDGDIDHILVDEAQDTSPTQWEVIRSLASEMTSGKGARDDISRTLFVVGDLKQSIYSFQGADPEAMEGMRRHFERQLVGGSGLATRKLVHSFRSAPAILNVVDQTFTGPRAAGLEEAISHIAFRKDLPGRVDLWPLETPSEAEEEKEWFDPVDRVQATAPPARLARRIATEVRRWVETETIPAESGAFRPITESDVLILVQRRSALFHHIIRACKAEGLTVAGADRMRIQSELAARDIMATLAFLALPEDDLSLAAALRSPLFGWSEQDLYRVAEPRGNAFLWKALRESTRHPETLDILGDLLKRADFDRPHELIERLLTHHGGRARLLARLGVEAEEGIDALLSEAMRYEQSGPPSLTGFLNWHIAQDTEIKRQAAGSGAGLRVMTVHGAKGLESPIVILPDTLPDERDRPRTILQTGGGVPLWSLPKAERPAAMAEAAALRSAAEANERRRLLYVAMTRAENWLVVAGAGKEPNKGETWYEAVRDGMMAAQSAATRLPDGTEIQRIESGNWTGPVAAPASVQSLAPAFPAWIDDVRTAPEKTIPLKPSDLGGAKAMTSEPEDPGFDPLSFGTDLHALLELLPGIAASDRPDAARRILPRCDEARLERLLQDASRLLDDPELSDLFAEDSLAEVEVSAMLNGQPLRGAIDRLILRGRRVLAIDFKSNRAVPSRPEDVPEGILRQMGAYSEALSQIFPDREIATAILWTSTGTLMELPHDIVRNALTLPATS